MKKRYLGTAKTREFIADLASGKYDNGDVVVTVATSYPADAEVIRTVAKQRKLERLVLVNEFDDVSNPERPTAISGEMAALILAFLQANDVSERSFLFVCDGGVSRSAAMLCAWIRLCGEDDLPLWVDDRRYAPNVLVYLRLLKAGGVEVSDRQLSERELLKSMVLGLRVAGRKAHTMHLPQGPWEQISAGESRCVLRRLDERCGSMSEGDLVAFSMVGAPDSIVVAGITQVRVACSIDELLADGEVLGASGFRSPEEARVEMSLIYGTMTTYPVAGIILDAGEWISGRARLARESL